MRAWMLCCVAIAACGGGANSPDAGAIDAGVDAVVGPDAAMADLATAVQCGPTPPAGPGSVPEFQRYTIDQALFPDARCNDGSAPTLYFRPYVGAANRDKWVINLHGGGACTSGPSCVARWCSCANLTDCPYAETTTNFTRQNMIANGPAQKPADGIFLRGDAQRPNPYGDYNQVELTYCTSDTWQGTRHGVALDATNPVTGAPVTFRIDFLGARVLDADLAVLRQDGVAPLVWTRDGGATALPDLDDASLVIVAGDSAGGAGTIMNLDDIHARLAAANSHCQGASCPLEVYGLMDAIVGPEMAKLDFSTFVYPEVRSYADYVMFASQLAPFVDARRDASCLAAHPTDPAVCGDDTHVLRNHVTTPFFVRMALGDQLISGNYIEQMLRTPAGAAITLPLFALTLHDELTGFAQLSQSAEEGDAFTREPGVFAPACSKHDTIHDTVETFGTTITPPGGAAETLLPVFQRWQTASGTPTSILTEKTDRSDTNCP